MTGRQDTHLLALSHQKAQHPFEQPFEAVRVKADDVRGDNDEQREAQSIDNCARVAIGRVEIQSEEACAASTCDKLHGGSAEG